MEHDLKPTTLPRVWFTTLCLAVAAAVPLALAGPQGRAESRASSRPTPATTAALTQLVTDIQRHDYRGDLDGLHHDLTALAAFDHDPTAQAPVRYWRGFALWRLAINRMNQKDFDKPTALRELREAAEAFRTVPAGAFAADSKSAAAACLMTEKFQQGVKETSPEWVTEVRSLMKDAMAAAPTNPRVLWIVGGQLLWAPSDRGGSRARALETYHKGLDACRPLPKVDDPLLPRWGEPELLMSLAFAWSEFEPIDLVRAEAYAREALALVPEWHYARDILLPGILAKSRK